MATYPGLDAIAGRTDELRKQMARLEQRVARLERAIKILATSINGLHRKDTIERILRLPLNEDEIFDYDAVFDAMKGGEK